MPPGVSPPARRIANSRPRARIRSETSVAMIGAEHRTSSRLSSSSAIRMLSERSATSARCSCQDAAPDSGRGPLPALRTRSTAAGASSASASRMYSVAKRGPSGATTASSSARGPNVKPGSANGYGSWSATTASPATRSLRGPEGESNMTVSPGRTPSRRANVRSNSSPSPLPSTTAGRPGPGGGIWASRVSTW
jgi:hypothetical protein